MVVIKDAIHGNIHLSEVEKKLIDTSEFQRLRGVKQLGLAYLVYPGAQHTRFEHALGVMHITGEMCSALGIRDSEREELRCAALLHDVGHLAFSHEGEAAFAHLLHQNHEQVGKAKILRGEIADVLTDEGISPSEVVELMLGRGKGHIIAGDVGADRIDYLLRDAHYTGVAYGVIDAERIIHTARLGSNGELQLEWGGLEAAESLLIARYLMFSTVYMHHAVRIAASMIRRAMERAVECGALNAKRALELDDAGMMNALSECVDSEALAKRVQFRKLYKRAHVLWWSRMSPRGQKLFTSGKGCLDMEKKLTAATGLVRDDVIIDVCEDYGKGSIVRILMEDGSLMQLSKVSAIVDSVSIAEQRRWRAIVACDSANLEKVKKAGSKLFAGLVK